MAGEESSDGGNEGMTGEELDTYLQAKIDEYIRNGHDDEALWYGYQGDFRDWTEEHFRIANGALVSQLRTTLRQHGVWVAANNRRGNLASSLFEAAQSEDMGEWTDNEVLALHHAGKLKDVKSDLLRHKISIIKDGDTLFGTKTTPGTSSDTTIPPASGNQAATAPENQAAPASGNQAAPGSGDQAASASANQTASDLLQRHLALRSNTGNAQPGPDPTDVPPRTIFPTTYQFTQPQNQAGQNQISPSTPQTRAFYSMEDNSGNPAYPPLQHAAQLPAPGAFTTFGRELTNLTKSYTDDIKYGSEGDNFGLKLMIFYDICDRVGVPKEAYRKALPVMLKGLALDYYYSDLINSTFTFEQLCQAIQHHFEDANYRRSTLTEWNTIDLEAIKSQNPDKPISQCFQLLVNKLRTLRHGLTPDLQSDTFMLNKLVLACRSVPACQIACSAPPDNLSALISSLKTSITAYEFSHKNESISNTFMTDRRYYSNSSHRYNRDRPPSNRPRFNRSTKRCFICKKEGCWSTNHSESEQKQARERFKSAVSNKFGDRLHKPFERTFRQYLIDTEGTAEDTIDDAALEAFQSFDLDDADEDDSIPLDLEEEEPAQFMTSIGGMSDKEASAFTSDLCNNASLHSVTADLPNQTSTTQEAFTTDESKRYNSSRFFGIMIDTGASRKSTVGYDQYLAYCTIIHQIPIDKTTESAVTVKFGIGTTSSIGSIEVASPIGKAEFHIVLADTPFLLSIADMDRLKTYLDNTRNVLVTPQGEVAVVRQFGHPFLLWDESLHAYLQQSLNLSLQSLPSQCVSPAPASDSCYLTETELRRLHKRFGHPSVHRLQRVLERAGHDINQQVLKHLTKYCTYCQKHGASPGRFRFTLRDDAEFNYCIYVDVMYINGNPVLHIIDEASRYQAGRWLKNISAKHTWDKLRECWIDTYLGPPDLIAHDAGKNFISQEFKQYASAMGTATKSVPVEAHNSIGIVERYHGPWTPPQSLPDHL
jgi:hypothetical protein